MCVCVCVWGGGDKYCHLIYQLRINIAIYPQLIRYVLHQFQKTLNLRPFLFFSELNHILSFGVQCLV